VRQEGGHTPLDSAIHNGDDALARLLRDHGAEG
jgi:ankyrin repeat protein